MEDDGFCDHCGVELIGAGDGDLCGGCKQYARDGDLNY